MMTDMELKAYKNLECAFNTSSQQDIVVAEDSEGGGIVFEEGDEIYLKSEADKVIAELKAQVHDYAQGLYVMQARAEMELRHSNHKRCLAMAKWCESEAYIHEQGSEYDEDLVAWFGKWYKRWLELAEKFKEAK